MEAESVERKYPSARSAWYALIILVLLYSMSFMDRLILSLLASSISADLHVSDTQIGILFGLGFGVVYSLTGLPLAHVIDKHNRIRLVTLGVLLWSACTVGSGFSSDYTQLMILRAGVAVGEAVLSPAAISIIADIFPRDKRTLPTTAYTAVSTFMGAGSFVLGGLALKVAQDVAPGFGLEPWQLTLVFVGVPGLLLAPLLFFTVREPKRVGEIKGQDFGSVKQALEYVSRERRLYGCIFIAAAMMNLIGFAKTAWVPTLMIRAHGLTPVEAGMAYGTAGILSGVAGAFLWPMLAKRWTAQGHRDALVLVYCGAITAGWMLMALVGVTKSTAVLLFASGAAGFFTTAGAVLIPLIIQFVTPGRMRARIMAGYLTANNLVGMAFGPPLCALIADHFFEGEFAIGYALTTMICFIGPVATLAAWLMRKSYVRALDEAERRELSAAAA